MMSNFLVPTTAPTSVNISESTSSSVTVEWKPLDCNCTCDIVGYSVQYKEMNSENGDIDDKQEEGCSANKTTITNLKPSTAYSFKVAAMNSAGVGVYSDAKVEKTSSGMFISLLHFLLLYILLPAGHVSEEPDACKFRMSFATESL